MSELLRHAHSTAPDEQTIASELLSALGHEPGAIVLFYCATRPGEEVVRRIARARPGTPLLACMSAGELSTGRVERGSVVAAGLQRALVKRAAVALAHYGDGLESGLGRSLAELEQTFGPLARLDPATHVGLILLDACHAIEERTHVVLGNRAPLLSFVGGSSTNIALDQSRIVTSSGATSHGCGLMVLELARPFHVTKTCHFGATAARVVATKVDGRLLCELDGRPAAQVYAEHVGCRPEQLDAEKLAFHPIGLVIDGEPWLRQVWPPARHDGALTLNCEVAEGSELYFMEPTEDIVSNLARSVAEVRRTLGAPQGALLFDCVSRRTELLARGAIARYAQQLNFPAIGFHTAGESWIGHMAQTLTALYFG